MPGSLAETQAAAIALAGIARAGDVLLLEGDLGAGKTAFARAFVQARLRLAGKPVEEVPSPTFTLVQVYEAGGVLADVWHVDLYRLDAPEDAFELGLEEAFADAVTLIEWPDRLGAQAPAGALTVRIGPGACEDARDIAFLGGDAWAARLSAARFSGERGAAAERFLAASDWSQAARAPRDGDASFRRYERLVGGPRPAMLMDAPPPQEDIHPYVTVARHLHALGYSAPEIFALDETAGLAVIEDFGDATYTACLARGDDEAALYTLAVDLLIDLHSRAEATAVDVPPYDMDKLLEEAALLVDWYLPAVGHVPDDAARRQYYEAWRSVLDEALVLPETLVLRDFHVDNLMRIDGRPGLAACGLLDFQDALIGSPAYDLVSLLEDARRDVPPALARAMTERYLAARPELDTDIFAREAAALAAQRAAKIIGIFTRLLKRDGKPVYLRHIPRVWRLLESDLGHPALRPVRDWLDMNIPRQARVVPEAEKA